MPGALGLCQVNDRGVFELYKVYLVKIKKEGRIEVNKVGRPFGGDP